MFDVTGYFMPDASGATYSTPSHRPGCSTAGSATACRHVQSHARPDLPGHRAGWRAGDAVAVTGNLTVTDQTARGTSRSRPDPHDNPTSSTLNFPLADNRANGVTVALSAGTLTATYVGSRRRRPSSSST